MRKTNRCTGRLPSEMTNEWDCVCECVLVYRRIDTSDQNQPRKPYPKPPFLNHTRFDPVDCWSGYFWIFQRWFLVELICVVKWAFPGPQTMQKRPQCVYCDWAKAHLQGAWAHIPSLIGPHCRLLSSPVSLSKQMWRRITNIEKSIYVWMIRHKCSKFYYIYNFLLFFRKTYVILRIIRLWVYDCNRIKPPENVIAKKMKF